MQRTPHPHTPHTTATNTLSPHTPTPTNPTLLLSVLLDRAHSGALPLRTPTLSKAASAVNAVVNAALNGPVHCAAARVQRVAAHVAAADGRVLPVAVIGGGEGKDGNGGGGGVKHDGGAVSTSRGALTSNTPTTSTAAAAIDGSGDGGGRACGVVQPMLQPPTPMTKDAAEKPPPLMTSNNHSNGGGGGGGGVTTDDGSGTPTGGGITGPQHTEQQQQQQNTCIVADDNIQAPVSVCLQHVQNQHTKHTKHTVTPRHTQTALPHINITHPSIPTTTPPTMTHQQLTTLLKSCERHITDITKRPALKEHVLHLLCTCTTVLPRQLPTVLQQLLAQYTAGHDATSPAVVAAVAAGGRPGIKAAVAMLFRAAQQKAAAVSLSCHRLLQKLAPERYKAVQVNKSVIREVRKVQRQPVGRPRAVGGRGVKGRGGGKGGGIQEDGGGDAVVGGEHGGGQTTGETDGGTAGRTGGQTPVKVEPMHDSTHGQHGQHTHGQNIVQGTPPAPPVACHHATPVPPVSCTSQPAGLGKKTNAGCDTTITSTPARPGGGKKVKYVRLPEYVCHACETTPEGEDASGMCTMCVCVCMCRVGFDLVCL